VFRLLLFWGLAFFGALCSARSDETHRVAPGDTLYALSRKYGVSIQQIQDANPGLNPKSLKVGQRLRIPGDSDEKYSPPPKWLVPSQSSPPPAKPPAPREADVPRGAYRVRPGDSLRDIADRYDTTTAKLRAWNDLPSDRLVVGKILRVVPPDVPPPRPPDPVRPAAPSNPSPPPERAQDYFFISKVKREIDAPYVKPGRWKYIVVHHSGTKNGNLKIFDYYHRHKGMENGVAYHFVIGNGTDSGDGEIEVTNRWKKQLQGGHLASESLNQIALGICLVGDFNSSRPTRKQVGALVELIEYLSQRTGTRPKFVIHREINPKPTDCPGRYFPAAAMHRLFDGRD